LLSVPLRLERSAPGERVTVPGAFVPVRRIVNRKLSRISVESNQSTDVELRFQLPATVLPLKIEQARVIAKIDARSRRLILSGRADGASVELYRAENPVGPFQ